VEGISFSKVRRLTEQECIELTAGRAAKGYKRLSPDRRANPNASQEEIARIAGVSRSTVWRIERGQRGALVSLVG
jgi:transcriptional regulator with XRE-family HTH domain